MHQTVVIRLSKAVEAFQRTLDTLGGYRQICLTISSSLLRNKLVAYELLSCPELLQYNTRLSVGKCLYTTADTSCLKQGCVVLRAPLLSLVSILMEATSLKLEPCDFLLYVKDTLLQMHPPHECCWFSSQYNRACGTVGYRRPFQAGTDYVFCQGHWNSAMRDAAAPTQEAICTASEGAFDDWLKTIV